MAAHPESQARQASPTRPEYPNKGAGRPTTYTPATAELIAMRLCDGETLSEICRTPGMPTRQTVHQWRMRMPAFDALYLRARAVGMESMSDDLLTIADDDTGDLLQDGSPNSANVQRARLQVDARKFLMAKLAPKVYGDRVEVEHSGGIEHRVQLDDRERMRRLATFLAEDAALGHTIEGRALASPAGSEEPGADAASPAGTTDHHAQQPAPTSSDAHTPGALDEPRTRDDEI